MNLGELEYFKERVGQLKFEVVVTRLQTEIGNTVFLGVFHGQPNFKTDGKSNSFFHNSKEKGWQDGRIVGLEGIVKG